MSITPELYCLSASAYLPTYLLLAYFYLLTLRKLPLDTSLNFANYLNKLDRVISECNETPFHLSARVWILPVMSQFECACFRKRNNFSTVSLLRVCEF